MTPRLESEGWWAQVVALVVADQARGRDIGRALVERAETLSLEAGCGTVIINSSRSRAGAHAFSARLGHRDRCEDHAQFGRSLSRPEDRHLLQEGRLCRGDRPAVLDPDSLRSGKFARGPDLTSRLVEHRCFLIDGEET